MTVANRWPAEDDEVLRRLWPQPISAEDIGARLGRSKNSVIGRASRLGLPARVATRMSKRAAARASKTVRPLSLVSVPRKFRVAPTVRAPVIHVPQPVYQPVLPPTRYGDMAPGQCKNIIGNEEDVFDRLVCGNAARPGESWCEPCRKRLFTTPPDLQPRRSNSNSSYPRRRPAFIAEGV